MRTTREHFERLKVLLGEDISIGLFDPAVFGLPGTDLGARVEATEKAYAALLVVFADKRTHEHLELYDPKALEQVGKAIKGLHKAYRDADVLKAELIAYADEERDTSQDQD